MPDSKNKILSLDVLAKKAQELKSLGKKVVLSHGIFDLIHNGHISHLKQARNEGDILIVTLVADEYVDLGPSHPIFSEKLRAETLAALECVNYVGVNHSPIADNVIDAIQPYCFVKGGVYESVFDDPSGGLAKEKQALDAYGGLLKFTPSSNLDSPHLLYENLEIFSSESRQFLNRFRASNSYIDIVSKMQKLSKLKVLVVGDAIIDEYHYVAPLGQAGKGLHLAVKYDSVERFAGGSLAVANHIAGFSKEVTLVASLGKNDGYADFVHDELNKRVSPNFFSDDQSSSVVKRRYVDFDMNKLFEVYYFNDEPAPEDFDKQVCHWLDKHLNEYDLVVVPDFGNGFLSQSMVDILCDKAKFLAVNTQLNSGNRGYHVINRYSRADFISLNEPEIRLATHNRHGSLESIMEKVSQNIQARWVAVTRGTKGAIMLDRECNKFFEVPSLSTKVVDRIGAGDTFLSIASLCLKDGLSAEIATFLGSAAAALSVGKVCNRDPVSSVELSSYVTTLLK
jgi:rfaE bifunctional protein kinase chain/domain